MSVLVAYSTKHGSTREIAQRIAATLKVEGLEVELQPIKAIRELAGHEAFVIGSAAYMGSWMKDASEFVRRNRAILSAKPVWLFSSGPLGTATADAQGRDLLTVSEPKEFAEFKEALKPRELKVFFGALDPSKLTFTERLVSRLPAGRALLPEGDFRDWTVVEAWAESIAHEFAPVSRT